MSSEISSLLHRLEVATSRLEEIAGISPEGSSAGKTAGSAAAFTSAFGHTDDSKPAEKAPSPIGEIRAHHADALTAEISELDAIINELARPWVKLAKEFHNDELSQQADTALEALLCHRDIVKVAPEAKQPTTQKDAEGFRELSTLLMVANDRAQQHRQSPFFNHLELIADSIQATTWIMNPQPSKYITSVVGDARIWENKIRREHKTSTEPHIAFVNGSLSIFKTLAEYASKFFNEEMTWNPQGRPFSDVWDDFKSRKESTGPSPTTGAPPAQDASGGSSSSTAAGVSARSPMSPSSQGTDMKAVLGDIRSGSSDLSPLSRPSKSPVPPHTKPKPVGMRGKKPKKVETNDQKKQVFIEFAEDEPEPLELEVPFGYSVLISECKNSTIMLGGKANAISVMACKKVNLLVDAVVSGVEVVNSKNFNFQAKDEVSSLQLDRVDSAELYINRSNVNATVVTSACVGVNIVLLDNTGAGGEDGGDSVEVPIPEQFITSFKNGELATEVYRHAG